MTILAIKTSRLVEWIFSRQTANTDNWDNFDNERTAYYAEYQTSGVSVGQRVSWSRQLTATEANRYSNGNILGGWIPPA
jgi:pectinesterase